MAFVKSDSIHRYHPLPSARRPSKGRFVALNRGTSRVSGESKDQVALALKILFSMILLDAN